MHARLEPPAPVAGVARTRAVARACATNPASIVIPCHRVVRTDGDLGGYRWGLQRKRRLLDLIARGSIRRCTDPLFQRSRIKAA